MKQIKLIPPATEKFLFSSAQEQKQSKVQSIAIATERSTQSSNTPLFILCVAGSVTYISPFGTSYATSYWWKGLFSISSGRHSTLVFITRHNSQLLEKTGSIPTYIPSHISYIVQQSKKAAMEEQKVQALHDTLAKLKKSQGLGIASHYNFGGKIKTKEVNGQTVREDGLPSNPLYFPFVREGSYDRNASTAAKYGDGREIKRDFEDCKGSHLVSDEGASQQGGKKGKKASKEQRKAEKKAAKLEAKRQTKLEEKRRAKIEAKKLEKQQKKKGAEDEDGGSATKAVADDNGIKEKDSDKKKKSKKDKKKRSRDEEAKEATTTNDDVESNEDAPKKKKVKEVDTAASTSSSKKAKKEKKKSKKREKKQS